MPFGDVLLHTGDFTELGLPSEVKKFNDWLGKCAKPVLSPLLTSTSPAVTTRTPKQKVNINDTV